MLFLFLARRPSDEPAYNFVIVISHADRFKTYFNNRMCSFQSIAAISCRKEVGVGERTSDAIGCAQPAPSTTETL
jgi:hypothetical protein